ncbi:MAG: beta-ketoacyl synthase [Gammaproteobacteria bacterium]
MKLPVIVSYGGINAAGRSVFDLAHKRMVFDSLSENLQSEVLQSLGVLCNSTDKQYLLSKSLIRTIDEDFFVKHCYRDPKLPTRAGGQLPSGFNPALTYNARQHPRALAMTIFAASDAVKNLGIPWESIIKKISLERISCISGCAIAQGDKFGMGGMFQANLSGSRATSKHLAMSLGEMSADFAHSYVLGSMGVTGNHMGACATFHYNLRLGIELIKHNQSDICFVGAAESGIVPEVYEAFAATKGLAEDDNTLELQKELGEQFAYPDHRKICRPFGKNVGMSLGEAAQFIILMSDELAIELGLPIYGAAISSHIHADGYKKSISGPGAGNYISFGKCLNDIVSMGDSSLLREVFIHAHGTGTPQNRVTESHILSSLCGTFGMQNVPVTAIKSYLGHSLACAGGDQIISALGSFQTGIIPRIASIQETATDVFTENLNFLIEDMPCFDKNFVVLNSKGFGGNNASALLTSHSQALGMLEHKHGKEMLLRWQKLNEQVQSKRELFKTEVLNASPTSRYIFGEKVTEGITDLEFTREAIFDRVNEKRMSILSEAPFKEYY